MDLRNDFLQLCEEARRCGFPLLDDVGECIGRGFADVGCEVFLVLPGRKLLSLFTGEQSEYRELDREHYFSVPEVETLVRVIEAEGDIITHVLRRDARDWEVSVRNSADSDIALEAEELKICLLKYFLQKRQDT